MRRILMLALLAQVSAASCGSDVDKKTPAAAADVEPSEFVCGNGVLEAGELCDTTYNGPETCDAMGSSGTVSCNSTCDGPDHSACDAPVTCGDELLQEGELCDGSALQTSCEAQGFSGGTIGCAANCLALDTSACVPTTTECTPDCGSRVCGSDPVCGMSCGTCAEGSCDAEGQCLSAPPPQFAATPIEWEMPSGGKPNQGYFRPSHRGYQVNDERWATVDLDGDARPDFVQTGEALGLGARTLGSPSQPHWLFYRNTGTGFDTPTNWPVPVFSDVEGGASFPNDNLNNWELLDIDGDQDLDLVRTGNSDWVFGYPSNPNWRVYENNGSGFSRTATTFPVPVETNNGEGFTASKGWANAADAPEYRVLDMNGDARPDLVVTGRGKSVSTGTEAVVVGGPTNPRWDVYLNDGSGFATTPIPWAVPSGGTPLRGFFSTGTLYQGQIWTTRDINGDQLPDLVITSDCDGFDCEVFGVNTAPHWRVYLNEGDGFAERPLQWTVPAGGEPDGGFNDVYGGGFQTGSDIWYSKDLDGDGRLDLVLVGHSTNRAGTWLKEVYGHPEMPHWKVYFNQSDGFAATPTVWPMPAGGLSGLGFVEISRDFSLTGDQLWSTTDITGDGKPDLVVTGQAPLTSDEGEVPAVVFGGTLAPFWKVYPGQ